MTAALLANCSSKDSKNHYKATGDIVLEILGDIPLSALDKDTIKDLIFLISRLPANHGKLDGNNRFKKDKPKTSKRAAIRYADQKDAKIRAKITSNTKTSLIDQRSQLAERLIPRLTSTSVFNHLNRLHAILRAAAEHCGYNGPTKFLTRKEMEKHLKSEDLKKNDPLLVRASKPKIREAWTNERLQLLLTSPIYSGCTSTHRRWMRGRLIIRDAQYWVPLIVMPLGTRILEILQLKKSDLIVRSNVVCLRLGVTSDHQTKTEDSNRYVPVPQLLLDLGFVEWVQSLPKSQKIIFDKPAAGPTIEKIANNFGKRIGTLYRQLNIADWNEDFYALRKTCSSRLDAAGVSEVRRQTLAGHANGSTIYRSYTAHNVSLLKPTLIKLISTWRSCFPSAMVFRSLNLAIYC